MSIIATQEYKVLLTHKTNTEVVSPRQTCWRATVLGLPDVVEEGDSREQVIVRVQARIAELIRSAEIMTLTIPTLPKAQSGTDDELTAQGWDDHGTFTSDAEALQLFDDIEEERNRHPFGGERVFFGTPTSFAITSTIIRCC